MPCFPLIYRRVTRYLDTDDESSFRKRESPARLKQRGLHSLIAIIASESSLSPFSEQPCLPAWLHPCCQNTHSIRYAEAEHGSGRPWVDFLPAEQPALVRSFLNEIGTQQIGTASSNIR